MSVLSSPARLSGNRDRGWRHNLFGLPLSILILSASHAHAQPTIDSSVPDQGATGVSTAAPVVFTFSTAMDESSTTAQFYYFAGGFPYFVDFTPAWNSSRSILACLPTPGF